MDIPDSEELVHLFAEADIQAIHDFLGLEDTELPSLIYQNWTRLMEAESLAARSDPVNYVQEVVLIPDVISEFVPLFLARNDAKLFLDSHFLTCPKCGESHFTGFYLSPTLPYHPATQEEIDEWMNGEKRIPYRDSCNACSAVIEAEIPPAIPPTAWVSWWQDFGVAKVLHDPLREKITSSRRFDVERFEENVMDEILAEMFELPDETEYHIPLIVHDYEIGPVAIDVVRSIGLTDENGPHNASGESLREMVEQFNVVCEQRGIREKIFIVLGTIPKSLRTDLAELKKWFYTEVTRENSKYRGLELHVVSYPEELDLILNQRLYGRAGPGDEPLGPPRLYDLNAWEMALAGIDFGDETVEQSVQPSFGPSQVGTQFEYAVRELHESRGYQVHTTDELDRSKVDLLCHRSEGESEHFRLVQCKYGSINQEEISRIDSEFNKIEDAIRDYWGLLSSTSIDRMIAVRAIDPELEAIASKSGFEVLTLDDLKEHRDNIPPNLRKVLGI